MIPEGWREFRLDNVIKLASGDGRPTDVVAVADNRCPNPVYGGNGVLGFSGMANSRADDIIIGRVGEYCGITRFVPGAKWITDNALYVRTIEAGFDRRFLVLKLQHYDLSRLRAKGGQPLVSQKPIYGLRFYFPSENEQKAIWTAVESWSRAIETVEALIANARVQKQALMQQLLPQGTTPPKRRLPGFSGEWRETSLGSLGETYGGLTGKSKNDFGSGSPFITYKNVFENGLVDPKNIELVKIEAGERQHAIRNGDILFTTSSETPEEVGMSSVVTFDAETIYLNSFCFGFRPSSTKAVRPHFASHFFRSASMRRQISALAQGSTRYNISKAALLKLSFHLPNADEQDAIADVLGGCDAELFKLTGQLSALRQEKAALVQQLLTGKRRVKLPESEAAHA